MVSVASQLDASQCWFSSLLSCFDHRYLKLVLPHVHTWWPVGRHNWNAVLEVLLSVTGSSPDLASTANMTHLGTLLGTSNWLHSAQHFQAARWFNQFVCLCRHPEIYRSQRAAARYQEPCTWFLNVHLADQLQCMQLTSWMKCSTPMYPIRVHSKQSPVPYYVAHHH